MRFNERSSGLIDDFKGKIFHILGCGAIGSSVATQLARIGRPKVLALRAHILNINLDANISIKNEEFTQFAKPLNDDDIIIIGFDNMEIRKVAVTEACNKQQPFAIIDGRMGAEEYQQYVILKPTLKKYLKYWYSDENASSEPCNAKATSYCSNMSGAFITNAVKKILTGERYSEQFFFHFQNLSFGKSAEVM